MTWPIKFLAKIQESVLKTAGESMSYEEEEQVDVGDLSWI
jgi:hypothetical protein